MTLFVVVPIVLVLIYSFTSPDYGGTMRFTLSNYVNFFNVTYMKIFLDSLVIALLSSFYCVLFGYPAAMILANRDRDRMRLGKKSSGMLMLFVMPMWMNMMLRTYSWLTILESNGLLNTVLGFFHLPKVNILYTTSAVVLGMVYDFIPFMILPLYSVLAKIDLSLKEAAEDLGANPFKVFMRVTLPLTMPGIFAASMQTFIPALGLFYVSDMLGGGSSMYLGNLIKNQFLSARNWPLGAALSLLLIVITIVLMRLYSRVGNLDDIV